MAEVNGSNREAMKARLLSVQLSGQPDFGRFH